MSLPGRLVATPQGRVFVHDSGRMQKRGGPAPLVMLHGFLMSHEYFRPVIARLAQGRRVIAIDHLGYGESDRPLPERYRYDLPAFASTVLDVLDALDVPRADVLGHSLGGGVALYLGARHARRVARLVLACPTIFPLPMPQAAEVLKVPLVGERLWKYAMRKADVLRVLRRDHAKNPGAVTPDFVDYLWERLERSGGKEASFATLQTLMQLSHYAAEPARVVQPTQLVWGDEDRVVPEEHGVRLAREIERAELVRVPEAGHLMFMDQPDAFTAVVERFLNDKEKVLSS